MHGVNLVRHLNQFLHTVLLSLQVPVRPTRLMSLDAIQPSRVYDIEAAPSATPVFITEVEPSVTPEYGSTQVSIIERNNKKKFS